MQARTFIADLIEIGLHYCRRTTTGVGGYYRPHRPMMWHQIYDDKTLTSEQRRANRNAELPDKWTAQVWQDCRLHWKGRCAACGSTRNLQKDHLVPVAHMHCPGAIPTNLIPLCSICNSDKSYFDFAEWYSRAHGNPTDTIERIWDWQEACFKRGWR